MAKSPSDMKKTASSVQDMLKETGRSDTSRVTIQDNKPPKRPEPPRKGSK